MSLNAGLTEAYLMKKLYKQKMKTTMQDNNEAYYRKDEAESSEQADHNLQEVQKKYQKKANSGGWFSTMLKKIHPAAITPSSFSVSSAKWESN